MTDQSPRSVGRYEWERLVRRCVLPAPVKHVAAALAQYANADGTRVYPGVARLAAVTSLSERSVRGALSALRDAQLITRTRKGSSLGRQAMTDEHRLTCPPDLTRRVHMLDPDETPASAQCTTACEHPLSPAPRAGVRVAAGSRSGAGSGAEHRHLVPGTPAPHAGTPAPHDRNTGTTCTPPPNYQPIPPNYQRADYVWNSRTERAHAHEPNGHKRPRKDTR